MAIYGNRRDYNRAVIYGTTRCVWCDRAKQLLDQYNFKYQFKNIEEDTDARNEFKSKLPGVRHVPVIYFDGKHIGGYQELAKLVEETSGGYGDGQF